jgi:hypothetical protein
MYFINQIAGILLAGTISHLIPEEYVYHAHTNNFYSTKEILFSFFFQELVRNGQGYSAVTRYEEGFIAVGTDGRIDRISISGAVTGSEKFTGENLNCIISNDKRAIAAGDRGTILISSEDGIFRKIESHTRENINCLSIFKGIIIAGTDHGSIITDEGEESFKRINLDLKGNIVSVSARQSDCFGVTDEGEIIHSADGIKWDITDFNKVYSGYYRTSRFKKILATESRIVIAGIRYDGSPVLMFSTLGNVWTERPLIYTDDQGREDYLTEKPSDIGYDYSTDEFYLACTNGKLMKLPSCSQCNKLSVLASEDLEGISFSENTMMLVGENFLIKAVSIK